MSPDAAALVNEVPAVTEEVVDMVLVLPVLRVAGAEPAKGMLRPGGTNTLAYVAGSGIQHLVVGKLPCCRSWRRSV